MNKIFICIHFNEVNVAIYHLSDIVNKIAAYIRQRS